MIKVLFGTTPTSAATSKHDLKFNSQKSPENNQFEPIYKLEKDPYSAEEWIIILSN